MLCFILISLIYSVALLHYSVLSYLHYIDIFYLTFTVDLWNVKKIKIKLNLQDVCKYFNESY
jgi:hypothetical protein